MRDDHTERRHEPPTGEAAKPATPVADDAIIPDDSELTGEGIRQESKPRDYMPNRQEDAGGDFNLRAGRTDFRNNEITNDYQRTTTLRSSKKKRRRKKRFDTWSAKLLKLPLAEYILQVYEKHMHIQDGEDDFRQDLFRFFRLMKTHPSLFEEAPDTAFERVTSILETWTTGRGSVRPDPWEHFFNTSRDEAESQMFNAIEKARYMPGRRPLEEAFELADKSLVVLRSDLPPRPKRYPKFIAMAAWLQCIRGEFNDITLPVEDIGALFGLSSMMISNYRKWADDDQYLWKTKEGKYTENLADEFWFDLRRFPQIESERNERQPTLTESIPDVPRELSPERIEHPRYAKLKVAA